MGVDSEVFAGVAGALILDARTEAGLTQAELARRAGTAQSAIAAYESGRRQPTLPTLYRLLAAAGFDLRARLTPHDPHDETLAAWEASLPEPEREVDGPFAVANADDHYGAVALAELRARLDEGDLGRTDALAVPYPSGATLPAVGDE